MNEQLFEQIYFDCKKEHLFEQVLREMGRNSSSVTANNYVNIVEIKRKQGDDIWNDDSINDSIVKTIERGRGTDNQFILNYTKQEEISKEGKSNAWFNNLKTFIQNKLNDIAPDANIFEAIKQKFISYFKKAK
jgi:hypothetical protein